MICKLKNNKIRRKDLEVFSYNDYIKCIHTLRLNAVFRLAEEGTEYNLEIDKQKKEKDKLSGE